MSAGKIAAWTRERLKELLPGWLGRHVGRVPATVVLIAAPLTLLVLIGLGLNWTFGIVESYQKGVAVLHGGAPDPATQQQVDALRAENAAMQAKIDAILKAVSPPAGAAPLSPAEQAAKEGAVAGLLSDLQPAAQAAARDLVAGDVSAGFDALEREARASEASAAEKWRRLGALAAGVDTARARAAYEQAFRLDPTDFWACVALAEMRQQAGDLRAAGDAAHAAEQAAGTDRAHSVADNTLGDVLVQAGDLAGARKRFEEGLTIAERLAAQNPGSAEAQRDVSVSLERLGDVLVEAGDLAGARARFEKSLELRERLAAQNPGSAEAQRDVWVSLWKMAKLPESRVTWQQVVARMEAMRAKGTLAPPDVPFLDQARANAAAEAPHKASR